MVGSHCGDIYAVHAKRVHDIIINTTLKRTLYVEMQNVLQVEPSDTRNLPRVNMCLIQCGYISTKVRFMTCF